jgi:hypothetical protein
MTWSVGGSVGAGTEVLPRSLRCVSVDGTDIPVGMTDLIHMSPNCRTYGAGYLGESLESWGGGSLWSPKPCFCRQRGQ